MKKITTLISIIGFQYIVISQTNPVSILPTSGINQNISNKCSIAYSAEQERMVCQDSSITKCREIVITSIAPGSQITMPIQISFGAKGVYTFKKGADVIIPENRDVYIEDLLTGMTFNLKTSDTFSFSVNRSMPERFVLRIEKPAAISVSTARN